MKPFVPAARSKAMMMAVMLGTALASSPARGAGGEPNPKAIQEISRYCQACWRNARLPADHWQDCTQEVFARLLQSVEADKWGTVLKDDETLERREFIRAIDAVKKRTQRTRKFSTLSPDLPERINRTENSVRDDRDAIAKAAREMLSPRQRRILELAADGWAIPDIANELATTAERISDEKYKAVKKLQHHFSTV